MFLNGILATAAMLSPQAQLPQFTAATRIFEENTNLLSNGGFELWPLGSSPTGGPIAPGDWYAMGQAPNPWSQPNLVFARVPEPCAGPSGGPWQLEVRSNIVNGFFAQRIRSGAEFGGKTVTFSVDFSTPFPVASPRIEIYDGVSSTSYTRIITGSSTERFTVERTLDTCSTTLEFRIYPDQTVRVDHAMAVYGGTPDARYVPASNDAATASAVRLGVIEDWHRFNASVPVPDGYAICDGSLVTDPDSPFFGLPTPNLADRFVRGVIDPAQTGQTGGTDTINLAHTHTHAHTHSGNVVLNGNWWWVGTPNFGAQCPQQNSSQNFTTGQPNNSTTSSALGNTAIVPRYVGLLKIVRIK